MTPPKLLTDLLYCENHAQVLALVPGVPQEQGEHWAFYKGNVPYLLVAHTDTVTRDMSKFIIAEMNGLLTVKDKATPLGADDRAGVYACIEIAKRLPEDYKPSLLLCDKEEQGGIGAKEFKANEKAKNILSEFNLILELDRKNTTDFINYNSSVEIPKKLITQLNSYDFWDTFGTYSDISDFKDLSDVAMLNLSVGFHNEHTVNESLNLRALQYTIHRVASLLHDIRPKRCTTTKKTHSTHIVYNVWPSYGYKDDYYDYGRKAKYPNTITNIGLNQSEKKNSITTQPSQKEIFYNKYCKICYYLKSCSLVKTDKYHCLAFKKSEVKLDITKSPHWNKFCGDCIDYIKSTCFKKQDKVNVNSRSFACSSFVQRPIYHNPVTCGECADFITCDMQNPNLQSCIVPEA